MGRETKSDTSGIAESSETFDEEEKDFKSRIIGIPVFGYIDKVRFGESGSITILHVRYHRDITLFIRFHNIRTR